MYHDEVSQVTFCFDDEVTGDVVNQVEKTVYSLHLCYCRAELCNNAYRPNTPKAPRSVTHDMKKLQRLS